MITHQVSDKAILRNGTAFVAVVPPLSFDPPPPIGRPPDDGAVDENELREDIKKRGFPYPGHEDEHWRSVRIIAWGFARNEENPNGPAFETARKQITKIIKKLCREPWAKDVPGFAYWVKTTTRVST
jgi:hypothetical protein